MNASASYVTGTHNFKIGYDGAIIGQALYNQANDPRMTYNYTQPSVNVCNPFVNPALTACGNTHLGTSWSGRSSARSRSGTTTSVARARPASSSIRVKGRVAERLNSHSFFAQDQWTFKRLTLSGALRYDHATSSYDSTCVGPDVFVPADLAYCTGEHDGVNFNDVSPRWGAVYDLFGRGKTAVKFNYGKDPGTGGALGRVRRRQPGAADGEHGHGELGQSQRQSHRRLRHRRDAGRGAPPAGGRRAQSEQGTRWSGVSQFHRRVRHAAVRQESVRARRGRLAARPGAHPVRPHVRRAAAVLEMRGLRGVAG